MTAGAGPGPAGSAHAGSAHAGSAHAGSGNKGNSPARGRDFGEFVRLALNAAADQVEPCTDGLIPIRARILARAGVPWPQAFAISRYWLGPK
jgi:hypothetical protein